MILPQDELIKGLVRQERTKLVLETLANQDRVFAYNVPAHIQTTYEDNHLLQYLERTYSASFFVIENSDDIKKYAKPTDTIVKKGEYKKIAWQINPGDEGIISDISEEIMKIKFKSKKIEIESAKNKAWRVVGQDFFWDKRQYHANETYLVDDPFKEVKSGQIIRYVDEKPLESIAQYVPDETKSVITLIDKEKYGISWVDTPNLKCGFYRVSSEYLTAWTPDIFFPAHDFKLVIANRINLEQVISDVNRKIEMRPQ